MIKRIPIPIPKNTQKHKKRKILYITYIYIKGNIYQIEDIYNLYIKKETYSIKDEIHIKYTIK